MKMANIDAVLDFMFTNPKDRFGVRASFSLSVFLQFICLLIKIKLITSVIM